MEQQTFFLPGIPPSQKNMKRIVYNRATHKPFIMSDQRVKDWKNDMTWIIKTAKPMSGEVEIAMNFYAKDRRRHDLDNISQGILDLLTANGIIGDDNFFVVRKLTLYLVGIRKENPGVDVTIKTFAE